MLMTIVMNGGMNWATEIGRNGISEIAREGEGDWLK